MKNNSYQKNSFPQKKSFSSHRLNIKCTYTQIFIEQHTLLRNLSSIGMREKNSHLAIKNRGENRLSPSDFEY
jgi:hypothetical protein